MRLMLALSLLAVACVATPRVRKHSVSGRRDTVRALVAAYQADTNMTPHSRAINVWNTVRYSGECFTPQEVIQAVEEALRCERELDRESRLKSVRP